MSPADHTQAAIFNGGVVWKVSKGLSKPELDNIDCSRRVYSRLVACAMCQAIEEWVIMSKPDNDKHVRLASRRHDLNPFPFVQPPPDVCS
ncbi:hypothetical protein CPC08DRAFT_710778 [Agrocybe pediades]|nr:hypothetical protein CPC08DRAFT_710778 [Agrocybe pediades]